MERLARTWRENPPIRLVPPPALSQINFDPISPSFSVAHWTFVSNLFIHMASILALCVMGMHLQTIWGIAKQMHLSFMPFNPVIGHDETPMVNSAGEEVGLQLEIYTKNGWEFFFCFDTKDRALRFAFWQEFPVGTTLNTGTCENARTKMIRAHINHRFYLDGQRVIILISHRPIDLSVFVQPNWQPFVYC